MTSELEDLRCIAEWGEQWQVSFNATKTKLLSFNRHRESSLIPLNMNDIELPITPSSWTCFYIQVGLETSCPFCRKTGITWAILYLYKATTRPCMEYCSHIWGGAPQSRCLDLFDKVHRGLVNLVGPVLPTTLQPLSHRVVASISLFNKYYHGRCSQELLSLVLHGRLSVRSTREVAPICCWYSQV